MTPLSRRLAKYATVKVGTDLSSLPQQDRLALQTLKKVGAYIDNIYLCQSFPLSLKIHQTLKELSKTNPVYHDAIKFFSINMGPFDKIADKTRNETEWFLTQKEYPELYARLPELAALGDKYLHGPPAMGNFYPQYITKEEFESWVTSLSEQDQHAAKGFYHIITRDPSTKALKIVPYSEAYKEFLEPAATLLEEASQLVSSRTLATFLKARAKSFRSNDYFHSECNWMDVDYSESPIDVTIGPYEVYTDNLFAYKSAFEMYLSVIDQPSTQTLTKFAEKLQELEDNLPVANPAFKNPDVMKNGVPPLVVVNEVMVSGDHGGPQTSAFNLPNDEAVIKQKGAKMLLLKNVQSTKFDSILTRIAQIVLHPSQRSQISFDAFFTHILLHEMSHSLGPHVLLDSTTVRQHIQEHHSALEEAKADIVGLWGCHYFIEKGYKDIIPPEWEQPLFITYLASAFRSLRFGIQEAHGKGQAVQLNYLWEKGGIAYDETNKTFMVKFDKIKPAMEELVNLIVEIQGTGDKKRAEWLMNTYGVVKNEVKDVLRRLEEENVPVDIAPVYSSFE